MTCSKRVCSRRVRSNSGTRAFAIASIACAAVAASLGTGCDKTHATTGASVGSTSASTGVGGAMPTMDPCAPFIQRVVSVDYGPGAGFGQDKMPAIVFGPPLGGGTWEGSLDVVKLGKGGSFVVAFGDNTIVDEPGPDFIVFTNPFDVGGDPMNPYAEVGTVGVSDDGENWVDFPCTATSYPYGSCAGWHPVLANAQMNTIDPQDPSVAGGDAFDLADIGVKEARFIRIVDRNIPPGAFDLDAIAIVKDASGTHATCSAH